MTNYLECVTRSRLPQITQPLDKIKPSDVRGWVLLNPDIEHLSHVLARCEEYNVNHVQISHGIVHSASTLFKEPWRVDRVNFISTRAHRHKIETFLWTHELDDVTRSFLADDGRVDLRSGAIWDFVKQRYEEVFSAVKIDGLVLTFQETQASVYHDHRVISDMPHDQRIHTLVQAVHDVCRKYDKKLIVRTFCYNRTEMAWILAGLKDMPRDIIIMVKCQPADWNPYYPHNRLIEHFANEGRSFIVEFDLGEEYHGQSAFPYFCPDYLRYRLNHVLYHQNRLPTDAISGAVARIERYSAGALASPNEINLKVFSHILCNPREDETRLIQDHLSLRYHAWHAQVRQLLAPTFDLINQTVYPHVGIWGLLMHSALADYIYAYDSLATWPQLGEWIEDKSIQHVPKLVLQGDPQTHTVCLDRMDQAERQLNALLAEVQQLASRMPIELCGPLAEDFRRMEAFVRVNLEHHRTFLALRRWEVTGEPKSKVESAFETFLQTVQSHGCVLNHLRTEGLFLNRTGMDLFIKQVRQALESGTDWVLKNWEVVDFCGRYDYAHRVIPG